MPNLFDRPLAIVDVETTGTSYKNGGIIELGIVRVEQGQVVATYDQLIDPGSTLPGFITSLTGITNEQVQQAPTFAEVADEVFDLLDGCVFVAHNARFDLAFIKEEFRRCDYNFAPPLLCTVRLSRYLFPTIPSHKLGSLISHFGIKTQDRHRAYADAVATWQLLQIMTDRTDDKVFEGAVKQQLKQPSLPMQLPLQLIDELPQGPGVYIFENNQGATLYVGKSINIRQRVLSHFQDDQRLVKDMKIAQEVAHIRTIPTCGELGALLEESKLIKQLLPIYNRMLRRQSEMVVAIKDLDSRSGYSTVRLERHVTPEQLQELGFEKVLAVYKTERQAKDSLLALAKQYGLCHKWLGLQKTTGACFAHQLKQCQGACVGLISPASFDQQLEAAFIQSRLADWPYAGPIIVTERQDASRSTSFVIDQWSVVGTIEERDQDITERLDGGVFNVDEYKIIKRFLGQPKNRLVVKPWQYRL